MIVGGSKGLINWCRSDINNWSTRCNAFHANSLEAIRVHLFFTNKSGVLIGV
jgi:hypothetical protein